MPSKFDLELGEAVKQSLQDVIEGQVHPDHGVFLTVTDVLSIGEGSIVPEDGAIHYPAEFKMLIYRPELNELVIGEVVDVTEFGAFTRIGPLDALVHVSQIMDDKIAYDPKGATFTGKKTGSKLKEGDMLPSERDLAQLFDVSRVPVREALKILEFTGVAEQVRGKGWR